MALLQPKHEPEKRRSALPTYAASRDKLRVKNGLPKIGRKKKYCWARRTERINHGGASINTSMEASGREKDRGKKRAAFQKRPIYLKRGKKNTRGKSSKVTEVPFKTSSYTSHLSKGDTLVRRASGFKALIEAFSKTKALDIPR